MSTGEDGSARCRVLIVNVKYARRFLEDNKSWELRGSYCRCVKEGELFYLLESGIGQNSHGVAVFRLIAKLKFIGQEEIKWGDLRNDACKAKHRCNDQELDTLRNQWKNRFYKGAVVWKLEVAETLQLVRYLRCSGQDWTCLPRSRWRWRCYRSRLKVPESRWLQGGGSWFQDPSPESRVATGSRILVSRPES